MKTLTREEFDADPKFVYDNYENFEVLNANGTVGFQVVRDYPCLPWSDEEELEKLRRVAKAAGELCEWSSWRSHAPVSVVAELDAALTAWDET